MPNQPSKNIVLIGMRGSGKTSIGRTLANYLGWQLIDVDRSLEAGEGVSIPELVHKHDWEHFRDLESKYAAQAAQTRQAIIATGGGIILRSKNIETLKKTGVIVLLHSPLEHLQKRVAKSNRPSLTGADPAAELAKVWAARRKLYEAAADVSVTFDFQTTNKKSDLIRKSKIILKAILAYKN